MARLEVNGVHLNVETAGEGPPVVLLHGFTGSAATWAAHTDGFSAHHTVVAVDLLGHGLSDAPEDPRRYRLGFCIEDVLAVLDRLGIARASLLGYSMGGRVALAVAIAAPERLTALVIESASPGIRDAGARRERAARDEELAKSILEGGVEAFVDRWEHQPLFASQRALADPVRLALRAQRLRGNALGLANSLRGLGQGVQPPLHDFLPQIPVPTLIVVGALDETYTAVAREMSEMIPDSRLAVVPGAGHAVHLEQPEHFRQMVLEFLEQAGSRQAAGPDPLAAP